MAETPESISPAAFAIERAGEAVRNIRKIAAVPLGNADSLAAVQAQATLALAGAVLALTEHLQKQPPEAARAPDAPSGFMVSTVMGDPENLLIECVRPGCRWDAINVTGVNLTELAAAAQEHKREAHGG